MVGGHEDDGEGSRCNEHKKSSNRGPYVIGLITLGHYAQMVEEGTIKVLRSRKVARVPEPSSTPTLKPIQRVMTPESGCKNAKNSPNWVESHGWPRQPRLTP